MTPSISGDKMEPAPNNQSATPAPTYPERPNVFRVITSDPQGDFDRALHAFIVEIGNGINQIAGGGAKIAGATVKFGAAWAVWRGLK